mgnify:CR=1 FL=1
MNVIPLLMVHSICTSLFCIVLYALDPAGMIPKELIAKIRRLEIRTRSVVENVFGGEYQTAFKGRGIEFAEVRPYQVGDDIRSIDWNVSARMGDAYVKVYEEEREQTVMLVLDVSASGAFGSQDQMKRDIAAEIAAVMAFSAVQNHDKVGLLLFSDRVEEMFRPRHGRRHVLRLIREVFTVSPTGTGTDIAAALQRLTHVLRRRAVVILISDFLDTGYERAIQAVARRHDTVAVEVVDPREEELPPMGLVDVTDAETGETRTIDTQSPTVRRMFARAARERRDRLATCLRKAKAGQITVRTDADPIEPLIDFFRRRNRSRHG